MKSVKYVLSVCIYCLLIAQIAQAEELTLQQIASHLNKDGIIHADFDQVRSLSALTRPIRSYGKVVVAGNQGIIWQIDYPCRVKYLITSDGVIEVGLDEPRKTTSTGKRQPFNQAAKLIGSLLDLNDMILSKNFAIKISGDINLWTIVLKPHQKLSKFISTISISGGAFMNEVNIIEATGDSTHLTFHDVRRNDPLSLDELKLIQGR